MDVKLSFLLLVSVAVVLESSSKYQSFSCEGPSLKVLTKVSRATVGASLS